MSKGRCRVSILFAPAAQGRSGIDLKHLCLCGQEALRDGCELILVCPNVSRFVGEIVQTKVEGDQIPLDCCLVTESQVDFQTIQTM